MVNKDIDSERRTPRQTRAMQTWDAILDAAAQILRTHGEARFTTNHIAERAGVSIGTLYQYFADKDAILNALSDREVGRLHGELHAVAVKDSMASLESRARHFVRALIDFFARRRRSRRIVLLKLLAVVSTGKPDARFAGILHDVTAMWNESAPPDHRVDALSMTVLSQALLGVLRSTMILQPELLESPALEDRLVHLVLSYLCTPLGSFHRQAAQGV